MRLQPAALYLLVLWCSPWTGLIQHSLTPHLRTDSSVSQHYLNDPYNAAVTLPGIGVIRRPDGLRSLFHLSFLYTNFVSASKNVNH